MASNTSLLKQEQLARLTTHNGYLHDNMEDGFMTDLIVMLYQNNLVPYHLMEKYEELLTRDAKANLIVLDILFKGTPTLYETFVMFCKDRPPAEFYERLHIETFDARRADEHDGGEFSPAIVQPTAAAAGRISPPLSLQSDPPTMQVEVTPVISEQIKSLRHKSKLVYQMSSPVRGMALLVLCTEFSPDSKLPRRHGAEYDRINLSALFINLGYNVRVLLNCTAQEVIDEINRTRRSLELASHGSFVLGISSHGGKKSFSTYDGSQLYLREILDSFDSLHCPYLAGKPKFLFFDVTSGNNNDSGVSVEEVLVHPEKPKMRYFDEQLVLNELNIGTVDTPTAQMDHVQSFTITSDSKQSHLLPIKADFIIITSSFDGYLSYRRRTHGCWFSRILVEVFQKHAKDKHIVELVTLVRRKLAVIANQEGGRQVCTTTDSLLKRFYFFPGMK